MPDLATLRRAFARDLPLMVRARAAHERALAAYPGELDEEPDYPAPGFDADAWPDLVDDLVRLAYPRSYAVGSAEQASPVIAGRALWEALTGEPISPVESLALDVAS